jgi:hypothetical protein
LKLCACKCHNSFLVTMCECSVLGELTVAVAMAEYSYLLMARPAANCHMTCIQQIKWRCCMCKPRHVIRGTLKFTADHVNYVDKILPLG